jgi:hypothetical protein
MNLRFVASCGFVGAALLMAGCDSGRQPPGRVTIQVANVAPGFNALKFRRENDLRTEVDLPFEATQTFVYDADTYDFNVTDRLDSTDPGQVWTFQSKLEENTYYSVVLTEVAGEVQPVIMPIPLASTQASDAQIVALNATSGLPAMDLYLERTGVGIAGATPRGTFNSQEQIPLRSLPGGDYELFLTAAGNPADVLLTTQAFNLPNGSSSTLIVAPEGGLRTVPVSVLVLAGASPFLLTDIHAHAELRAINGATDQAPRDLAIDSQFSPPLFSAMPFGEAAPYAQVPTAAMKVNVTPVGDPGVLEIDATLTGGSGQRTTMLFSGSAGTLLYTFAADDQRRFNREGKIRFMNAASQWIAVDFVLTYPDLDPTFVPPLSQLLAPGVSGYVPVYPGDYDLYLYATGTPDVLSGPTRITLGAGGIYGVLAVDGPDTATATVRLLEDFVP